MTADAIAWDKLWSVKRVADFLGYTSIWFYRNRAKLERDKHFPVPLVGHRYDPLAIKAWRLAQLNPRLRAVLEQAPGGDRLEAEVKLEPLEAAEDWATRLDRRAADMAAAGD